MRQCPRVGCQGQVLYGECLLCNRPENPVVIIPPTKEEYEQEEAIHRKHLNLGFEKEGRKVPPYARQDKESLDPAYIRNPYELTEPKRFLTLGEER